MRHLHRPLTTAARPFTSAHTYRRWAYLIIGGALLTPYAMAGLVLATLITQGGTAQESPGPGGWVLGLLITLAALAATARVPAVAGAQHQLARALLRGPLNLLPDTPPAPGARTFVWLCLFTFTGMAVCLATMVGLTESALLAVAPLTGDPLAPAGPLTVLGPSPEPVPSPLGPLAGLALLLAVIAAVALTGHLMARLAPRLLGPSPASLLADAQARARTLAERNRLARELHDSLGHALSVITLQSATAARLIDTDPDFARQALTHIADQARTATADLDHALGILREDTTAPTAPPPDLTHLTHLAETASHTGTPLRLALDGDPRAVPALLSRETYRIAQQALTNALTHAPGRPLDLTLDIAPRHLHLTATNPLPPRRPLGRRRTGGRGITGMQERAHLLGGTLTAGPHPAADPTHWTLDLTLNWKDTDTP
ncbi:MULTISPECIES: sensor histidine kinase [Nocardiopsis]|uniref:histidine kinase n=1 Tax=Nocardiopsis changdeensis TaxID=2831969 RepID=A0ABX8BXE8_9ACTN|nr:MULTISPECIES: histidine kinase [Nocardiopsis]QUX25483.1 histidine kinase [Nocardiopsis changdeensis]QYX35869.1 histidine kinase [Nocardiopsis sp. MT53]